MIKSNNYVYFNCDNKDGGGVSYGAETYNYASSCEVWRIIGVFNVDNGNGNSEIRVKLVRVKSIGEYIWDSSASSANNGGGVNEWSQADLNTLLNNT